MDEAIDAFIRYLSTERGVSPLTIKSYSKDLDQFCTFLEEQKLPLDPASITPAIVRSFLDLLYDRVLTMSSIERKVSALKSFFGFLYRRNFIVNDPMTGIGTPRKEKHLPHFLHDAQLATLLNFQMESFVDFRDRALLEIFYSTGARVSEIALSELVDLNLAGCSLKVKGKGSVERIVFLTGDAANFMGLYLAQRRKRFGLPEGKIFVNANGSPLTQRGIFYIIQKRSRAAGFVNYVTPHTFRHSFATELLNNGADIRAVQEMLGHRSLSTTQVYTHTTKKRLSEVYHRCHPHANKDEE